MRISIKVTPGIERAAKFSKQTVREFCLEWIAAGVQACEDDYVNREFEELENAALEWPARLKQGEIF